MELTVEQGRAVEAGELYALASHYGHVTHSWWEDVAEIKSPL